MLLLILFVLFFIVLKDRSLKVTSEQIVTSYISDIKSADAQFLNKEIEISGKVKSFFQFEVEKSLLELETGKSELQLFCLLMNKETEEKASSLTAGSTVTIRGKCLGIKDYKFPNSIYIEVEQIK
jgi:hypothetical protein